MIIGVTGSIGSGKTTVCAYLRERGYFVIDADAISRHLMEIGQPGYREAVLQLGTAFINPDGSIDRAALARLIFQDQKAKEKLENILHPLILQEMKDLTESYFLKHPRNSFPVIWEVPLLFETGYDKYCDVSICVIADEAVLIPRVMNRSNLTYEEVQKRLHAQWPKEKKANLADYVIYNERDLNHLYRQVDDILEKIRNHDK